VLAIALAALSLLGLGIYGPGIATGLAAGAPQLGAGAAIGTVSTAWGIGGAAPATVVAAGSAATGISGAVLHGGRRAVSFVSGRGFSIGSDGGNGGPAGDSGSPPPARAGSSAGREPGPWRPGLGAAGRRSRRGCYPNQRPGTGAARSPACASPSLSTSNRLNRCRVSMPSLPNSALRRKARRRA
jgi:type IV secretion system protein TrbL